MKIPELKSILLELINETMFGHRIKISIDGRVYPALLSSNVAHDEREPKEAEYRITWFDPKTMQPQDHVDFGPESLNHILRYKKFPMAVSIKYFKLGLPTPNIIVDTIKKSSKDKKNATGNEILVGTIDPDDDYIEAKFGGSHQGLNIRNNKKGDFRFNDETETVYWHEEHPSYYEELVDEYILNKMDCEVKKHIVLSRHRGNSAAYTHFWNDAHGLEQPEDELKL